MAEKKLSFEQSIERLQEIVAVLEKRRRIPGGFFETI